MWLNENRIHVRFNDGTLEELPLDAFDGFLKTNHAALNMVLHSSSQDVWKKLPFSFDAWKLFMMTSGTLHVDGAVPDDILHHLLPPMPPSLPILMDD